MSVKIRLRRAGAKKAPSYRVVVADSRSPRDGRFIEELGHYNPSAPTPQFKVDREKAIEWLSKGAQPSDTVLALFRQEGILREWEDQKRAEPAATQTDGAEAPA